MRPSIPAVMATLLALGATPALAADDTQQAATDEMGYQRLEVPEAGIAMSVPSGWNVHIPMASRESEIRTGPDAEPVYVTTVIMANAGDGRWCDVDVYGSMPVPLEQHVYAYAGYLQSVYQIDRSVAVTETQLPVGDAFRIDMDDAVRDRIWAMYLFDGPTDGETAADRFLLTCVADPGSEPYWQPIAESVELLPPVETESAG